MFRVRNNVPDVYIHQSRDFQLLSNLYDLMIQSSRFSIDSMLSISDCKQCNSTLLPLLAKKIGIFDELTNVDEYSLRLVLSAFPHIVRYKGSIQGIQYIINLFSRIINTQIRLDPVYDSYGVVQPSEYNIVFVQYSKSIDLLKLLLDYVTPTGVSFNIVLESLATIDPVFRVSTTSKVDREFVLDYNANKIEGKVGIATIGNAQITSDGGGTQNE